jgi:N-acetylglucosaminyldiphosphoundecaprenol N-acetyl-beta-D-mannosaminyltransferase
MSGSVDILGVRISRLRTGAVVETFKRFMTDGRPHSVYIVNAATANLAYEHPSYRNCLNRGDLVLNDGTGVRWAARLQGKGFVDNHVGTDLMPLICSHVSEVPLRCYFLGGYPGVAERAAQMLKARCPRIEIAGSHHGYLPRQSDTSLCDQINAARPHLLLVALGNPLQEFWIDRNLHRLHAGVAVGVGGLFDHLAGRLRRAPLWVRKAGAEWVHILIQQPHKSKRYLLGNPLFIYRTVRDRSGDRVDA